jgi:hypothetical protein
MIVDRSETCKLTVLAMDRYVSLGLLAGAGQTDGNETIKPERRASHRPRHRHASVQFESRAALTRGSGSDRATRTRHTHTTHERTRAVPRLPHRTLACGPSYFGGRLVSGKHQALVLPPWRWEGTVT